MAKGYLIARVRVHNEKCFIKFIELTKCLVSEYGGKVPVRNPTPETKEGEELGIATVIEFKNIETARKFYESEEYTNAKEIRIMAAETDLILVEGE